MDTSSLIEMKEKYPSDIFEKLWEKVDVLCKQGRFIAPIEVLKEIKQGDDELKSWAKKKKGIFINPDENQIREVEIILSEYPFLARPGKTGPNADPWLIALARAKNSEERGKLLQNKYIIVTEESKVKQDRIPRVCLNYNIECINLIELFRREGWRF